ncbi:MAG: hypothetical protein R3324_10535 [Halobacteriales archaeon]|nr:hypothetical protein [Halobacteriales archaeon]
MHRVPEIAETVDETFEGVACEWWSRDRIAGTGRAGRVRPDLPKNNTFRDGFSNSR